MDQPARWRAYICCGPNCTLRRSPALIAVLEREVATAGLTAADVEVLPGGCMKHCERGPSLAIWPGPVYYEHVDAGRLRRIVRQHLREGQPIAEWFYHEPAPGRADPLPGRIWRVPPAAVAPARRPAPPAPGRKRDRPAARRAPEDVDDFKW